MHQLTNDYKVTRPKSNRPFSVDLPPCLCSPCDGIHLQGKHVHAPWADLAEEMSRVEGAVVVRRPDLAKAHGMLAPDVNINYTKTLQSYMEIFNRFLFPGRCDILLIQQVQQYVPQKAIAMSTQAEFGRCII